jgi:hypothetical protein
MDFPWLNDETPAVPNRPLPLPPRRTRPRLRASLTSALAGLVLLGGCERIKRQLTQEAEQTAEDPIWQGDSTFLASKPGVLFRVLDHPKGRIVSPIATIGAQGFRQLTMGGRGWRAFDIDYLQSGRTLKAIREGRVVGDVKLTRGEWESGQILDSIPGCPRFVPAGLADVPAGVSIAVAGSTPQLKSAAALSASELQEAIATIPTLIAPSSGISTSMLARYKREVHVVSTGTGTRPAIVVEYNDPEVVSDTLRPIAQRPRQFIVVLDKGNYGYRPSYTFTTLGNKLTLPRLKFLDFLDVDSDGKAELIFAYQQQLSSFLFDGTVVLRFDGDAWREVLRELVRCQL